MKASMAADAYAPPPLWLKILLGFLLCVLFVEISASISEIHFHKSKPDPPFLKVKSVDNLTVDASTPAAGARFRLSTVVAPIRYSSRGGTSVSFTSVKGASWVTYGKSTNSSITTFSEKTDLLKLDFSMDNITGADADLLGKELKERKAISFELNFDLIVSWKKKNDWPSGEFHQVYSCPITLHLDRTGDPRIIHAVKDASLLGSPLRIRRIHGNAVSSNYSTVRGILKDAFFMVNNVCLDSEWGFY